LNEDLELVVHPETGEQQMLQSVVFNQQGPTTFGYLGQVENP